MTDKTKSDKLDMIEDEVVSRWSNEQLAESLVSCGRLVKAISADPNLTAHEKEILLKRLEDRLIDIMDEINSRQGRYTDNQLTDLNYQVQRARAELLLDIGTAGFEIQLIQEVIEITQPNQPQQNGASYTVQQDDTLSAIAQRYGVTVQQLVDLNNITNPNLIRPGQEIRIPTQGAQTGGNQNINREQIDALIDQYAQQYNLDSNLVRAVVRAESDFDPNAESEDNARGLMQLMPETVEDLRNRLRVNITDVFDPEQNIRGGTAYFRWLLDTPLVNGNFERALAAYNWGYGNLQTAISTYGDNWRSHVPTETANYLQRVTRFYQQYGQE